MLLGRAVCSNHAPKSRDGESKNVTTVNGKTPIIKPQNIISFWEYKRQMESIPTKDLEVQKKRSSE